MSSTFRVPTGAAAPGSAAPSGPSAPLGWAAVPPSTPRLRRAREDRLLAGVSAGLADHLGLGLLSIRIGFVVLSAVAGFGIALYAALWLCVPLHTERPAPPGLAAAARSGMRSTARFFRVRDTGQLVAFATLALGLLLLTQTSVLGVDPAFFWPALIIGCGVLLIWRQGDESALSPELAARREVGPASAADVPRDAGRGETGVRAVLRTAGWRGSIRILAGAVLVLSGLTTFVVTSGRLDVARDLLLGGLVAAAGIVLVAGPWLLQTFRALRLEREERILSQERADVAAHLHDSVLQTLALIQRQAQDPREVIRLARSQERDLRGWLYGHQQAPDTSLRAALERVAAEVEEEYGVPVEVVVVGDSAMDEHLHAVVQAAREALVNAAKHASAPRTDLYAEVEHGSVVAYVRDRGMGFDPSGVDERRLGLRRSIVERMARHGGHASVRSAPGEGTEVRLGMTRSRA